MAAPTLTLDQRHGSLASGTFMEKLNTVWHERANRAFMFVVLGHWAEHLAQAWQVWVLHWPRPMARGVLGMLFPWLVSSEVMHYGYALVMIVGIWMLRPGYVGQSRKWWNVALVIQFWHHIEHLLLISQVVFHHNLYGRPVPTSIAQLWIPRIELHLFYNTIVFIPMVVAMYYHLLPSPADRRQMRCSCALELKPVPARQPA